MEGLADGRERGCPAGEFAESGRVWGRERRPGGPSERVLLTGDRRRLAPQRGELFRAYVAHAPELILAHQNQAVRAVVGQPVEHLQKLEHVVDVGLEPERHRLTSASGGREACVACLELTQDVLP